MASKYTLKNKKILITSGPTWVPIDEVRIISNKSTGKMGKLLAQECLKAKAHVTLIEGPVTQPTKEKKIKTIPFRFYDELKSILRNELKKSYDIVIHAAAVSDYKLNRPFKTKLSSKLKKLSLELVPTEKLIYTIKKFNPRVFLVGFKLEPNITKANVRKLTHDLFNKTDCNLVVANTLKNNYYGFIVDKKHGILAKADSRKNIVKQLIKIIERCHCERMK